jgi:Ni,Fe-hydrogenase I cytochrome b subunit
VSSEGRRRLTIWHWVAIAVVVLLVATYVATQLLTAD